MSIVGQRVVESRGFSGWVDPRFPIGYWQAALELTGDASAGFLTIDLLFQTANGPARLNSQMYSVERLSIIREASGDRNVKVFGVNMSGPSNLAFSYAYGILLLDRTGGAEGISSGRDMNMLPLFLGSQRLPAITASFSMQADNDNTVVMKFEAEGYLWSPRSILIDGGPQRPPTGPYGQ